MEHRDDNNDDDTDHYDNTQIDSRYSKSPHIRTYQNKNLKAVFPKLCTLRLRTCFSLMKHRFLLQGLQS